jgi:hypothetical protein
LLNTLFLKSREYLKSILGRFPNYKTSVGYFENSVDSVYSAKKECFIAEYSGWGKGISLIDLAVFVH